MIKLNINYILIVLVIKNFVFEWASIFQCCCEDIDSSRLINSKVPLIPCEMLLNQLFHLFDESNLKKNEMIRNSSSAVYIVQDSNKA